jgi:uncharacterized membrane protein
MTRNFAMLTLTALLAACHAGGGGAPVPGDSSDHQPFSGIAASETIRFTGTEPFWGGESSGDTLTYTTPENQSGEAIRVKRFAGRGGVSLSGEMRGQPFDLTVTPGDCSDGMSDRTYPYAATLRLGSETRQGCAWTKTKGFIGPPNP